MTDNTESFKQFDKEHFGNKDTPINYDQWQDPILGARYIDNYVQKRYEFYQAATAQAQARIAELEKDANYIQDMFVKGYQLSYNAPVDWLTDEANKRLAWQVVRTIKPFCDAESNRAWVGSTPKEAIENCKKAIAQAIADSK